MKAIYGLIALMLASQVIAQDKPQGAPPGHEPPPQAYTDCAGKKAGDSVQHTTREGKVAATCENSPKGLVARPIRPKASQPNPLAREQ